MELETVKVQLPGNTYALVYKDKLRKTARLHEAELRKYMKPVDPAATTVLQSQLVAEAAAAAVTPPGNKPATPPPSHTIDYVVDLLGMEAAQDTINAIFILNQVAEWSFGPVDEDTLENKLSDTQYKLLALEVNKLLKPSPLSVKG